MKKIKLAFVIIVTFSTTMFGQNGVTSNDSTKVFDVNNIENYVFGTDIEDFSIKVDENNDIVFTKLVQNIKLSKEDIYNRALSFYIRTYKDAKSVLQQQDKEAGILIGKGIFSDFHCSKRSNKSYGVNVNSLDCYSAYHIMKIDIKDGKARIIISVSNYDYITSVQASNILASSYGEGKPISVRIVDCPPIDTTSITELIEKEVSKASSYKNATRKYCKEFIPQVLESKKAAFIPLCNKAFATISNLEKVLKDDSSKNSENW